MARDRVGVGIKFLAKSRLQTPFNKGGRSVFNRLASFRPLIHPVYSNHPHLLSLLDWRREGEITEFYLGQASVQVGSRALILNQLLDLSTPCTVSELFRFVFKLK